MDGNEDLVSEDKFQYLIQTTISGSRARECVNSHPPTAENCDKAIQALKSRFGREELLTEFYVRELLSLVVKNMSLGNSKGKISTYFLYDKLKSHLRALESIGMTQDKYAAMVFPLVESCVPEDLLRTWIRCPVPTAIAAEDSSNIYTSKLQQLLSYLKSEVEEEERISMAISGFKSVETSCYSNKYKKEEECSQPTACSLFASEQSNNKRPIINDKSDRFNQSTNLPDPRKLDASGINDLHERKSRSETELAAVQHFHSTVSTNDKGRFEVKLPWVEDQRNLENKKSVALKRLETTTENVLEKK